MPPKKTKSKSAPQAKKPAMRRRRMTVPRQLAAPAAVDFELPVYDFKHMPATPGVVRVAGCQALDKFITPTVTSGVPILFRSYNLNPLQSAMSRLVAMASIYEKFRWRRLEICYYPQTSSQEIGSILGYIDYDADDAQYTDVVSILNQRSRMYSSLWKPANLRYSPQGASLKWFFTSQSTDALSANDRLNFPGVAYIFSDGVPSSLLNSATGQLFVRYDVEFTDIRTPTSFSGSAGVTPTTYAADASLPSFPLNQLEGIANFTTSPAIWYASDGKWDSSAGTGATKYGLIVNNPSLYRVTLSGKATSGTGFNVNLNAVTTAGPTFLLNLTAAAGASGVATGGFTFSVPVVLYLTPNAAENNGIDQMQLTVDHFAASGPPDTADPPSYSTAYALPADLAAVTAAISNVAATGVVINSSEPLVITSRRPSTPITDYHFCDDEKKIPSQSRPPPPSHLSKNPIR